MTIAHVWMFAAYVAWMECVTGAWALPYGGTHARSKH